MSTGRFSLTVVAIASLAIALSGCTLQIEPPVLEMIVEPAYSSTDVLIPFELRGDGSDTQVRWTLRRYQSPEGEWEQVKSWQTNVPSGNSGIFGFDQVGGLYDAKYEITAELLPSRGGVPTAEPMLSSRAEFYVDTQSPSENIVLNDTQGGLTDPLSNYDPALALEITPIYDGTPDPDVESPVALYHSVDNAVLPTDDQDPTGETIVMWEGGQPSYNHFLTIRAIDQAGNVGSYRVETYRAP